MIFATGFFQDWSYDCTVSSALACIISSGMTSLLLQSNKLINLCLLCLMKSKQSVGIEDDCSCVSYTKHGPEVPLYHSRKVADSEAKQL